MYILLAISLYFLFNVVGIVIAYKNRLLVDKKNIFLFYIVAALSFIIDIFSKVLAQSYLLDNKKQILGEWLYLKLVYNPGAAFSFLSGRAWVFTLIGIGISGFILYLSPRIISSKWSVALGMLLGGTIGNLADRLFNQPYYGSGHVIDFIGYGNWFVGNIADIFIVIGVCIMLLLILFDVECVKSKKLKTLKYKY